ncbi:MAG: efflux RND transporter periplasmic adaptor subunit [Saprospiraceae bacterium]|jgi:cobalt-zinc-cadmium efflux system membrane fusion protein|nr:efflux RND transporter periplasmic adaptor subunit [Saprospiraceae bacterium]MBK9379087.1 efflux RND transporter periplasmic adaptor subunit [Saprospiraceae bacterium]MBL0260626.1 efflux RND transporter periplasmic adaptor subunit [Saprospiraceae bacterium]MBX7163676.1 efflux RND transporter periplasmic adaptor subunit [Saprospiraceae bacterium]
MILQSDKIYLSKLPTIACCIFISLTSCHNHKEGDNHSHGEEHETIKTDPEDNHEDESSTIAELSEEQIKAVGINFGTIESKELTATLKATGVLKVPNNNKANASSLYGGVIQSLHAQIGTKVKKGQVLATIVNPQFIQLQEEYLTILSKINLAEQELDRQKELVEGQAGAKKNLQNIESELKILLTRKAGLHKQLELMGIKPSQISNSNLKSALLVTSPIPGTISNVFAKIGSYIDVASPVAEIVDNNALHLDLNVFEKDLPLIKIGQTIHFTLTNNPSQEYDATVFSIGTAFENESKTIPVHCAVSGNKSNLIDGMNITAMVSMSKNITTAVPSDAIVESQGKFYIFIVTDKNAETHHEDHHMDHQTEEQDQHQAVVNFEKIEVAKGITNMGYTAITPFSNLPKDVKIVTKGAFFINAKFNTAPGHVH